MRELIKCGFGPRHVGLAGFSMVLMTACSPEVEFSASSADKAAPVVILDAEFAAGIKTHATMAADPIYGLVEQNFSLLEKPAVTATLRQRERPLVINQFKQGHEGSIAEEPFVLSDAGKLDLLIVIDNSASMEEEQRNLASKLSSLTQYLKNIDWQIAVVTTDDSCLQGARVIKSTDVDAAEAFRIAVTPGKSGSGDEAGIKQALRALQGVCATGDKTWLRSDSSVAVFFISDEESFCTTPECTSGDGPNSLIAYMNGPQLARPKDKLKAYALLWNKNFDRSCSKGKTESFGERYTKVLEEFNPGFGYGSICSDDYSPVLRRISEDVSRIAKREFFLAHAPVDSSLEITVDGKPFTDFTLNGKEIKVNSISSDAQVMKVIYRYEAQPKTNRFKLTEKIDPETVEVYVNDEKVAPEKYSYDEVAGEMVVNDMPADHAVIRVKYRDGTPLQSEFDVSALATGDDPIKVSIGDRELTADDFEFDQVAKVVNFKRAPADGQEVKVRYKTRDSRIVKYKVAVHDQEFLKNLIVRDKATGETLSATLEGDELVFDEDAVVDGRQVQVVYSYGEARDALRFDLAHVPLPGTVKLSRKDGSNTCIKDIKVDKKVVTFGCDLADVGPVVLAYDYLAKVNGRFKVGSTANDETTHWQVFIDGRAVDFKHDGDEVILDPDMLKATSKVRVIVTQG